MVHALFQVGIKALITDERGQVLLFKAGPYKGDEAHWDLPGGRMEDNQTPEETLRREIEEETGVTEVSNIEFLNGCISNIRVPVSDTERVGLVLFAYKVRIPEGSEITMSNEHTAFEWVELTEAAKRLEYKYPKEFTESIARQN